MESFSLYIGAFEAGSVGQMSFHKMEVVVEDINDSPAVLTGSILTFELFSFLIYFHVYYMKCFH